MTQYIEAMPTARPRSPPSAELCPQREARWRAGALGAFARAGRTAFAHSRDRLRCAAGGRCAVCRGWCAGLLCACCEARCASVVARCPGCAMPWPVGWSACVCDGAQGGSRCVRCLREPPSWSHVVAGVDYGHPWDGLLAGFKFQGRIEHADVLLQPLRARLREFVAGSAFPPGLRVLPVPLARARLRERGYNQAWELARRLAHGLGLPARADALFRLRDTGHQLGLARAARQANLHDAFIVAPRHAAWVRGAPIVLVDDVMTTGATADAAARTLLAAGAADVRVWVVARA
jgi:ComF family protein